MQTHNQKGIFYGLSSGMLWGASTALTSLVLLAVPFISTNPRLVAPALLLAFFNDSFSALLMTGLLVRSGDVKATLNALRSKNIGWMVLAALFGGPLGMRAYLYAVDAIGAGYTASISSMYPVVAAVLGVLVLKEKLPWYRWLGLLLAVLAVYGVSQSSQEISVATQPLGFIAAGLCVLGWACEVVISSVMMQTTLNSTQAMCIRQWVCSLAYLVFMLIEGDVIFSVQAVVSQPIIWGIMGIAVIGTFSYLNFYRAIELIGPVKATGLNVSYSIWAIVFSLLLVGGNFNWLLVVCSGLMIVGCMLVSKSEGEIK